ncbi:uracil-DNA glycosylase NDAI_0C00910 [Naumovozyma dairenensis CBS 421]|uniref:Uracil-DNA glycosylase n=1 Tax=Naumovozyma dairenensis (strain ATCC 10597 / BCRC 20456 / CBS 421 / NBRC 0211 / NRRL Y-12639) TaxID=1071378 RepID=G0W7J1_NAUDC|nr:hypothetical protein NDAI_0C00910 [Naumovozyma dairenensis CBS 421]CCD23752.1 hypothetical protein NDAI_0C00910 [Naumovozyma dairenensis CBS 421]
MTNTATTGKRKQTTITDFFNKSTLKKAKVSNEITGGKSAVKNIEEQNDNVLPNGETAIKEDEVKGETSATATIAKEKVQTEPALKPTTEYLIKAHFRNTLDPGTSKLLSCELDTIEDTWFRHLIEEFKKPYFLNLKQFILNEQAKYEVFPPAKDIYSWTRLTPFDKVKVVIIGQDPYHNDNQAHGLAFSVKPPVPAPPSLRNIYKELKQNYSDFEINNKVGDLSPWALQGVLLLNTALTVRAHNANSHSKRGWEEFTKRVIEILIKDREKEGKTLVFLLWGNNAIKLVTSILKSDEQKYKNILVLKSVHPSPLSASRGFFGNNHFKKINEWLANERNEKMIDWSVVPGNTLKEIAASNENLN